MHKILIVDDEGAVARLLERAFSQAGYEARIATHPHEAMGLCDAEQFDVVLSDVIMPDTNGHELVQWVAEHHPAIRTVLMSGYDLNCEGCPYAGRCALLQKPFRPDQVVSFVTGLLDDASSK